MLDKEDTIPGFNVVAEYESMEDADSACRLSMEQVGEVAKNHAYTGRAVVYFMTIYPSPTSINQNYLSEVSVDINCRDELAEQESAQFQLSYAQLTDLNNPPELNKVYSKGDVLSVKVPVSNDFGNEDSCVLLCLWAPDEGGDEFLNSLISEAENIWMSFISGPVLQ